MLKIIYLRNHKNWYSNFNDTKYSQIIWKFFKFHSQNLIIILNNQVIHVSKERLNGSKSLQLLTGTHFKIYWLSNYIFDMTLCIFNATSVVLAIKLMAIIKDDKTNELWPISDGDTVFVTWLLFFASSWCWCAFAYCASLLFKSDIVGKLRYWWIQKNENF